MIKKTELDRMRDWLGNGEHDIRLMERLGMVTERQIIDLCHTLTDSPWYQPQPTTGGGK